MDIKAIRLQNFMAFEDTDWIELRPITLFFGRNSSGKSVILRALRLLRQSLVVQDGSLFTYFSEDGVDVGQFLNICHGADKTSYATGKKGIRFSFRCSVKKEILSYLRPTLKEKNSKEKAWVEYVLEYRLLDGKPALTWFEIHAPWSASDVGDQHCILLADLMDINPDAIMGYGWWLESDFLNQHTYTGIENPWPYVEIISGSGFLPSIHMKPHESLDGAEENKDPAFLVSLINDLNSSIKSFLYDFEYIQPMRPVPKRIYVADQVRQKHWKDEGSAAFLQFLLGKVKDRGKVILLCSWLNELELGHSIEVESLSNSPEEGMISRVYLDEGELGLHRVSLNDVGFGASQVLPIILQSLLAKAGSLVMIEQPELHLHPRAQATLGDLFIEAIARHRKNDIDVEDNPSTDAGPSFLIETHSEHLLLRLRCRIAETKANSIPPLKTPLSCDDLRIYFVYRPRKENGGENTSVIMDLTEDVEKDTRIATSSTTRIMVDEDGNILNTPKGFEQFFSQDLLETIAIKKAQLHEYKRG